MMITSGCAIVCILINVIVLGHGTTGECSHSHAHNENINIQNSVMMDNSLFDIDRKDSKFSIQDNLIKKQSSCEVLENQN